MKKVYFICLIMCMFYVFTSCNKFLDEKSDKKLTIPNTVEALRALLNNVDVFMSFCSAGENSTTDFYLSEEEFNSLYYENDKRLYLWAPDHVSRDGNTGNDWQKCYKSIYICNSVLQSLSENKLAGPEADALKGQALLFRAAHYLAGVQVWCPIYNKATASTDLGMALRHDPDMNNPSVRASVQQTYDQIITDLIEASSLLPKASIGISMPTTIASYSLLARTYLIMGDYEKALDNVEKALAIKSDLLDFNTLDVHSDSPIPFEKDVSSEVIFLMEMNLSEFLGDYYNLKVSEASYGLYKDGDLRREVYFKLNDKHEIIFKGHQVNFHQMITGPTTAELYLIKAECEAQLDKLNIAESTLNSFLSFRWKSEVFQPVHFTDLRSALKIIFEERQRELIFRGLRWSDLKRLNRDGAGITLNRTMNQQNYVLPPNDNRWSIAIPEDIIELTKMPQNVR